MREATITYKEGFVRVHFQIFKMFQGNKLCQLAIIECVALPIGLSVAQALKCPIGRHCAD